MMRSRLLGIFLGLALLTAWVGAALAQAPYAPPTLSIVDRGLYRITVGITAGADGAPSGYGIQWMRKADYDALGGTWPDVGHAKLMYCECYGPFTLNTWDVTGSNPANPDNSPILLAGQKSELQIGDLNDEEGLYGAPASYYDQLTPGTEYVLRGYTLGDGNGDPSAFTSTTIVETMVSECTQGFWKTHGPAPCHAGNNANVWPGTCFPMMLGTTAYSDAQICAILLTPVGGNGLVSLAHQLITTKLNGCSTSDLTPVLATIAAADALINGLKVPGSGKGADFLAPNTTSALTETLDDYNNGLLGGVANCPTETMNQSTWGRIKVLYR